MKLAIIGQGYVGLNATVGALSAGHTVIGVDLNDRLVTKLNLGISHIEGIPNHAISDAITLGSFHATTDFEEIRDAEVVIIAVPTPLTGEGKPDLSFLESATDSIAKYLSPGVLVINESTSFIGTLRNIIAVRIQRINPLVTDFAVSPERVDPGNAQYGLKNTPRLVGGITPSASKRTIDFYSTFCQKVVPLSSPEAAEAAKLLENSFRFINIGFINEFTKILNAFGVSISEVISGASTKPYGFMPFFPNVGVGGHCIPVDPLYLQKNAIDVGSISNFIQYSQDLNSDMPRYSVERLQEKHGILRGKKVLVIGVSYKPDVSDTRESPAEHVIARLHDLGAQVKWHDPLVRSYIGEESSPVSEDYDLGIILVKHKALDLSGWKDAPLYCVYPDASNPSWISILD